MKPFRYRLHPMPLDMTMVHTLEVIATSADDAAQSSSASNAARQRANASRVIGSPCPGISRTNDVAAISPSAARQPSGHPLSKNGTSATTRSPAITVFVAAS